MQIAGKHLAGFHRLAYLLTNCRDSSLNLAVESFASQDPQNLYFSIWMEAWERRVLIAKALGAIREDLAASARRTELRRVDKPAVPTRDWTLDPGTTKAELEDALLAIDLFPRAALLLSIFESVPVADAAVLLDAHPGLVRKAQVIGLRELTNNLARMQGWEPAAANPRVTHREAQHV